MIPLFANSTGRRVDLESELAKGGEGTIYTVRGAPTLVAKVYHREPDSQKSQKVLAMSSAWTEALLKVAAWPTETLIDDRRKVRGFLMPRLNSRSDAHELYSPKSRAQSFPDVDFRFIAHVCANMARAFAVVHAAGHVIGDVNHGHMLVGGDGRVVLIDADSFQVNLTGRRYPCNVGVPLFTAPELLGRSFTGLVRTPDHDLFGLAVMLFHMLFLGRHPFSGVWTGAGDMSIERAIEEGRFAYGRQAARFGMKQPPGTLALGTFGTAIENLFEQSFSTSRAPRPEAIRWIDELDRLKSSLGPCSATTAHHYPVHLRSCPWCQIERGTGARLFGQKIEAEMCTQVDIASLWRAIEQVKRPAKDPPLPSELPWSPPSGANLPAIPAKTVRQLVSIAAACAGLGACTSLSTQAMWVGTLLLAFAIGIWPRVDQQKLEAVEATLRSAKFQWAGLLERWNREASVTTFDEAMRKLMDARQTLASLSDERRRQLQSLEMSKHAYQCTRYLNRFRIDKANIAGIGAGRAATLASFGIETAADVEDGDIMAIPGFGPKLCGELTRWRRRHENNFRVNPAEPVDPAEIQRVNAEITAERNALTDELQYGRARLTYTASELTAARTRLMPALQKAWDEVKLAELARDAAHSKFR